MTDAQIVASIKQIYEKKKELIALGESRRQEEQALIVQYKVDECNSAREEIIRRYSTQMQALQQQIRDIEEALGQRGI